MDETLAWCVSVGDMGRSGCAECVDLIDEFGELIDCKLEHDCAYREDEELEAKDLGVVDKD
jgi:hypothetical protein